MKYNYSCDAYPLFILPIDDPAYDSVTTWAIKYWTKWFGKNRSDQAKGRIWATVGGLR